ncbi:MAG: DUF4831 family protein [Prolixibacteraceae bacterium]|nr:DUF4831 family protein [Prolixibacteraceae bacterium]
MKVLTMLLAMLMIVPAFAQKKTKSEIADLPASTEGISYALPRTGIRVLINASQTTYVVGPYASYAEPLLGIRNASAQSQTVWEIESIEFETFAEPDPKHTYKASRGSANFLQLTADGILAGINSNAAPQPCCVKTITNSLAVPNKAADVTFDYLIDNPTISGRTTADQRAVQAANRILKARNVRYEIAAGMLDEFHPDGGAYEESFKALGEIEEKLLSLFVGKKVKENYSFSFDYIPGEEPRNEVIFRFDENRGFLPKTDVSGKPVAIEVAKSGSENAVQSAGGMSGAIFYRQPAVADIKLMFELSVIATGRITIAQLGEIMPIPSSLLDGTYSIELHPQTGALKSIQRK